MGLSKLPKISDAEWKVMKVLWKKSPLTAGEIVDALKPHTSWSPKTIHTLISRLVSKKAVAVNKSTPLHQYSPLVSEEECTLKETESFLKKVYDGSLHLLVAKFIKEEKLSPEELEELKKMLE
ncbi:MAG: BlaI/MecI/CopY family transcriptional regulator [Clostridia bacterium]|jgi:BlaI family penicillinase repressor